MMASSRKIASGSTLSTFRQSGGKGRFGRPIVQSFVGSLEGQHARRGVLITTSEFSADARAYVKGIEKKIVLIDGKELARLMFEFGVGVTPTGTPYVLKRVDLDFFE